jgi:hypothetical protein
LANCYFNQLSFGLEHEDNGNFNDSVRTDAEYASSAWQVADWCRRFGIPCNKVGVDGNHNPTEPGIVLHGEVSLSGTACPDGLDWQRIIREAQALLNGSTPAHVEPAAANVGGVTPWGPGNVLVNVQTLRVHELPTLSSNGAAANTPDGMLHYHELALVNGWIRGDRVSQDGITSDLWAHTAFGHYIWAPDTDAAFVNEVGLLAPEPAPLPEPVAPQAPAPAAVVVNPPLPTTNEWQLPYTGPALTSTKYITVTSVIAHDFEGKTPDRTFGPGVVFDVSSSPFTVSGVTYLRTVWSAANGRWIGLDMSKFTTYATSTPASTAPVTTGPLDGIQAAPVISVTTDKATQTTTVTATNGPILTESDKAAGILADLYGQLLALIDKIKSFGKKK